MRDRALVSFAAPGGGVGRKAGRKAPAGNGPSLPHVFGRVRRFALEELKEALAQHRFPGVGVLARSGELLPAPEAPGVAG